MKRTGGAFRGCKDFTAWMLWASRFSPHGEGKGKEKGFRLRMPRSLRAQKMMLGLTPLLNMAQYLSSTPTKHRGLASSPLH